MKLSLLKKQANRVIRAQKETARAEEILLTFTVQYLADNRGGVREIARRMGFSPQYICDVQHRRRKVSTEFVKRLERL